MPGPWWTKFVVLITVIVLSVIALIPTFYPSISELPENEEDWPSWYRWFDNNLNHITLGLDLQGGLHLQYQVDVDKAINDRLDRFAEQLRRDILDENPDADITVRRDDRTFAINLTAEGQSARSLVDDDTLRRMNLVPATEAGGSLRLEMDSDYVEQTRDYAIEQAIETIRRRIDSMGIAEPSISRRGDSDIIIQLPGADEERFEEIKEIIGTTAQLEFRILHPDDRTFFGGVDIPDDLDVETQAGRPFSDDLEVLRALFELSANQPPQGSVVRFQEIEEYVPEEASMRLLGYQPILLEADVQLTGEYVTDARVANDPQTNRPYVALEFDTQGGRIFCEMTEEHEGEQMAIILDEIVSSAPVINEPICGGRASINMGNSGSYNETFSEAERLVVVLRNGALPAPIEKQFETQVGPTLGAESVRAGTMALGVAFALVFVFVGFWYRGSGLIANTALLLNMLFIMAVLAALGATLTLPGIAGITLTVGMAIDANVIIFERIREELRLGKSARAAIDAGYAKAMSAVLDANITTAIACIVLMQYGSGPIRGFAITLLVGIFCSLYTAIIVTRLIFEWLVDGRKITSLSI